MRIPVGSEGGQVSHSTPTRQVRISPAAHRLAKIEAAKAGVSLAQYLDGLIERAAAAKKDDDNNDDDD